VHAKVEGRLVLEHMRCAGIQSESQEHAHAWCSGRTTCRNLKQDALQRLGH
jgi:hypothetical protein